MTREELDERVGALQHWHFLVKTADEYKELIEKLEKSTANRDCVAIKGVSHHGYADVSITAPLHISDAIRKLLIEHYRTCQAAAEHELAEGKLP